MYEDLLSVVYKVYITTVNMFVKIKLKFEI